MKKILISDKLAIEGVKLLERKDEFNVVNKPGMPMDEFLKEVRNAHGLIIRSATKVTEEVLNAAENLKVIARAGVGLDNVNIDKATEKGVVVMNTPGGNTVTTAEHAIALMFSLARKIPMADASMKKELWEKKLFKGVELRGKTIAIIGLGRIGKEVAKRCKGLSMRVIGYDPYITQETLGLDDIEVLKLEEIWGEADFITVHTPLTDHTRNLINKDVISKLKQSVMLINCARGGIYNEPDIYNALKEKRIAGAALDVFTIEPPKDLDPFHELDNVVLTPHLGASTEEAQVSVAVQAAECVSEYLLSGVARNSVNFPSLDINEYKFLKPFISLMEKMGKFQGTMMDGKVDQVNIFYSGDFGKNNLTPLAAAFAKGLIAPFAEININFVNATIIAKERGIKIQTGEDSISKDYAHLIKITTKSDTKTCELWGTIVGRQERIVRFDEYQIDFIPSGTLLVMHNNDVPNVVGSIGTFLGENKKNIANLYLARDKQGGKALSVIEIDDELDSSMLEKLSNLPEVIDVKCIKEI